MFKVIKKIINQSYLATLLIAVFLLVSSFTPFWNILLANLNNQATTKFINVIDTALWTFMTMLLIVNFILFSIKMKKVISKEVSVRIVKNKQYVKTIINFVFSLISIILIKAGSIIIAKQSIFNGNTFSDQQDTLILAAGLLVPITFLVLSYVLFMYAKTDIYPPDDKQFIYWFIYVLCASKTEQENKNNDKDSKKNVLKKFKIFVLRFLSFNKQNIETVINNKNKSIKITNLKMCNEPDSYFFNS